MAKRNKEKVDIKCSFCGHEWQTTSPAAMVTCPPCQVKTLNHNLFARIPRRKGDAKYKDTQKGGDDNAEENSQEEDSNQTESS